MKKRIVLILVIVGIASTGIFARSMESNSNLGVRSEVGRQALYERTGEDLYKNVEMNQVYSKSELLDNCELGIHRRDNARKDNNNHSRRNMNSNVRQGERTKFDRTNENRRGMPTFIVTN